MGRSRRPWRQPARPPNDRPAAPAYFATGSTYSIRGYCSPDPGTGLKYIYQARVLTGKTVKGAGGMKEPPNLPGRSDATYDSVSDNPAAPGMYVVFKDPQTYPEYLITFT